MNFPHSSNNSWMHPFKTHPSQPLFSLSFGICPSNLLWGPAHPSQREQDRDPHQLWGHCHLLLQHWLHPGGLQGEGVHGQWALERG